MIFLASIHDSGGPLTHLHEDLLQTIGPAIPPQLGLLALDLAEGPLGVSVEGLQDVPCKRAVSANAPSFRFLGSRIVKKHLFFFLPGYPVAVEPFAITLIRLECRAFREVERKNVSGGY